MKLQFIVVGKTTDKHLDVLIKDYERRMRHYLPFEMEVIPELKNTKALTADQQKSREGELIRKTLREGDHVVLLDEGGREFRSVEFASYLQQRQSVVARRLVFIVGGPYGFFAGDIRFGERKNIAFAYDVFTSDGTALLCGTMLSCHDYITRRAVSS